MTQIPILSGIYADTSPDFRTSYPRNLVPVPKDTGIAQGYLRPADGIVENGTGPGVGRGGINWRGVLYRVMGTDLVSIDAAGVVTVIGNVGGTGRARFTYGFTYLAIASDGLLWLYDGTTLAEVVDVDLGVALDVVWVDGYFMTTDGEFLVVTELNDPFEVNPLKYGSSEVDPDPVLGLLKLRNEVYALNRYTIEVFDNVGGAGFPFERIAGAQMQKGILGTHTKCIFMDNIAFLGSGENESPAIYMGANGALTKLSTREIDVILQEYTEDELADAYLEERMNKAHAHLIVHLPRHTLVFDGVASRILDVPVWFTLSTSLDGLSKWDACSCVWVYDKWHVCHPDTTQIGFLDDTLSSHWGEVIGWEFGTQIIYNESNGALFHELELVCLTGSIAEGLDPTIATDYSTDGVTFSVQKLIKAGTTGQRAKRLVWFQQGAMRNWRIQRFSGTSDAHIVVSRLEARLEPLAY